MVDLFVNEVRTQKHISATRLANITGISRTQIYYIENGESRPTIDTLCAIARGLGVPVTDLFVDTKGIQNKN